MTFGCPCSPRQPTWRTLSCSTLFTPNKHFRRGSDKLHCSGKERKSSIHSACIGIIGLISSAESGLQLLAGCAPWWVTYRSLDLLTFPCSHSLSYRLEIAYFSETFWTNSVTWMWKKVLDRCDVWNMLLPTPNHLDCDPYISVLLSKWLIQRK